MLRSSSPRRRGMSLDREDEIGLGGVRPEEEEEPLTGEEGGGGGRTTEGNAGRNSLCSCLEMMAALLARLAKLLRGLCLMPFRRGASSRRAVGPWRLGGDSSIGMSEKERQRRTEAELRLLNVKIARLLCDINLKENEEAGPDQDECVVCISAVATILTFPCRHQVTCQRCFVKTIQNAVDSRQLPLTCVICRCRITSLRNTGLAPRHPNEMKIAPTLATKSGSPLKSKGGCDGCDEPDLRKQRCESRGGQSLSIIA